MPEIAESLTAGRVNRKRLARHNGATAAIGGTLQENGKSRIVGSEHSRTEISSKFQYIVNYNDDATHYRSGSEFVWEYDGMQNVTKRLPLGFNVCCYYYYYYYYCYYYYCCC